jgi:GNAT superfamily N-acetyltransferase
VPTTADADLIADLLDPLVAADPVGYTVLGTIATAARDPGPGDAAWCVWSERDRGAVAARSRVETPVAISRSWTDLGPVAEALVALPSFAAVSGVVAAVEAAERELARFDRNPRRRINERLYRLDELVAARSPGGSLRTAGRADRDLLIRWWQAFIDEALDLPDQDASSAVDRALGSGTWLWTDREGEPVSMAARRPVVAGSARIGPVYTPPEHRGQGYASAVTAAVSTSVLTEGAVPVLFTDLSNPTSNKIYQQIGFRPVHDQLLLAY